MQPLGRTHLATAYVVDDSTYGLGRGSSKRNQRVYWRNMAVAYASASRFFGDFPTEFTVFSNAKPPEDVRKVFERLGVSVCNVPFTYVPPDGYHNHYAGSLYVLDVLRHYAVELNSDEMVIVIDPDRIWVDDVGPILSTLASEGYLNYSIDYGEDVGVHGLSRRAMGQIFSNIASVPAPDVPTFFGGELVGFTQAALAPVVDLIEEAWRGTLKQFANGRPVLPTEESILSYIHWRLGCESGNANEYVRRIHTSPIFRNVSDDPDDSELRLTLWHLPGEKRRGLLRLYSRCAKFDSDFWSFDTDDFKRYAATKVGIFPSIGRSSSDALMRVAIRARRRGLRALGRQ